MVYPKWLYHQKKEAVIVKSKEEHEKLGSEWAESPADLKPAEAEIVPLKKHKKSKPLEEK